MAYIYGPKSAMKRLLISLAIRLLRRYAVRLIPIMPAVQTVLVEALKLTAAVDVHEQSGEWKRHRVYVRLLKLFPDTAKRDIALAIELALRS